MWSFFTAAKISFSDTDSPGTAIDNQNRRSMDVIFVANTAPFSFHVELLLSFFHSRLMTTLFPLFFLSSIST